MVRNWTLSVVAYVGLLLAVAGCIGLARPFPGLGLTRVRAAGLLGAALVLLLGTPRATRPARHSAVSPPRSRLDAIVPAWSFSEQHEIVIRGGSAAVDAAVRAVTADEIRLFKLLTWVRSPRLRRQTEDILHAPGGKPILDVATSTTFVLLADDPGREVVIGTLIGPRLDRGPSADEFVSFDRPRYAKAVMNFRIEPIAGGACRLTTETRVTPTDARASNGFDRYWRLIFPGSALIRSQWLAAIRRRVEAAGSGRSG